MELLKRVWTAIGYAGVEATFYNALRAPSVAFSGDVGFFEPLSDWFAWGLGLSGFFAPSEERGTLDAVGQVRFSLGEAVALVAGISRSLVGNGPAWGLSLGLQTGL
jgi:hypothetical protein